MYQNASIANLRRKYANNEPAKRWSAILTYYIDTVTNAKICQIRNQNDNLNIFDFELRPISQL